MSNPKHPIITFRVKLSGDVTSLLHPDRHQSNQDTAIAAMTQHNAQKSTWFPNILGGSNIVKNHDGTFIAYGLNAKYIKDTYATGANALLTVVTETFASA